METVALVAVILAIPASVAVSVYRERRSRRATVVPRGEPCARLDDPPDDRAKAMPALRDEGMP